MLPAVARSLPGGWAVNPRNLAERDFKWCTRKSEPRFRTFWPWSARCDTSESTRCPFEHATAYARGEVPSHGVAWPIRSPRGPIARRQGLAPLPGHDQERRAEPRVGGLGGAGQRCGWHSHQHQHAAAGAELVLCSVSTSHACRARLASRAVDLGPRESSPRATPSQAPWCPYQLFGDDENQGIQPRTRRRQ